MTIAYLTGTTSTETVVEALDKDGVCIVTDLLSPDVIDEFRADVDKLLTETPTGEGHFWGKNTKRSGGLAKKSRVIQSLILQPTIISAVNSVLGEFCDRIQLNLTQAIRILPGEHAQVMHKDDEVFPVSGKGMEMVVNALWAVDEFTKENGATQLVPGSHKTTLASDADRFPDPSMIEYAEMPAGSVLLYRASLLHGGGANTTSLGWLRQAENQYLAYPPEIARAFSEELQALIGYEIHRPNLGWYEGQNPRVVLNGTATDHMAMQDHLLPEVKEMLAQLYEAA